MIGERESEKGEKRTGKYESAFVHAKYLLILFLGLDHFLLMYFGDPN